MRKSNFMEVTFRAISENEGFARVVVAGFCLPLNPSIDDIGDIKTAVELVEQYDSAFFAMVAANGMNFSAAIQGMYEIAGLGSRWRRSPYSSLTDAQMEILRQFLAERGLA